MTTTTVEPMHPIEDLIYDLLDEPDEGEQFTLSETAGNKVLLALIALEGKRELAKAIAAVVAYAGFLQSDCKSPAAATRLMAVAALTAPLLEAVVRKAKLERADTQKLERKRFDAFSNLEDISGIAPMYGQKVEGTIKASAFMIPTVIK